ncbi:DUF2441 domain-containing protein [Ensifer adhaerens]|uniref:DUF2441 domain-containing protein n=1 Tax=Ensifer adhaerens TaxID=106592 RepID=UPI00098FD3E7
MLRRYRPNHFGDGLLMARELHFEQARGAYAAHAPSQMNAYFMCSTCEDAVRYQSADDPHLLLVLHDVEFVELGAQQHVGTLNLLNENETMSFLDPFRQARDYWEGRGEGAVKSFRPHRSRLSRCFEAFSSGSRRSASSVRRRAC